MWKSCQEKTGLLDTKCCGESVVSVYVSWYVCETYVGPFALYFSFSQTILFFRRSAPSLHSELTRHRHPIFVGEGFTSRPIWLWVLFRLGFSLPQTRHATPVI